VVEGPGSWGFESPEAVQPRSGLSLLVGKIGAAGVSSVVKGSTGVSSVMGAGMSSIGRYRAGTYSVV
jgi:hypothetical protein